LIAIGRGLAAVGARIERGEDPIPRESGGV
jgi:hypothetical protein